MSPRHPLLVVAAVAVTVGAMLATVVASSEGVLWKMLLVAFVLGLPGALAATTQPHNPVGWLLMVVACVLSAMGLAVQVDAAGDLGAWAWWLVDRAGAVVVPLMFIVLVLLPDGRLPSPRWRPAVVLVAAAQVAVIGVWCLVDAESRAANPIGVLPASWSNPVNRVGDLVLQAPLVLAAAAIVVRLRRRADRAGMLGVLGGALGFAVLSAVGHSFLPAAADALDVLGAVVLGVGLTVTLTHRPPAPTAEVLGVGRWNVVDHQHLSVLSAREREVLGLVAEGLTNRQIADRLFISPVTARNHVSRILTKLGLENRTQAAAWLARGVDRGDAV